MLTLKNGTYSVTKVIGLFLWTQEHQKNVIFDKFLSIFKFNLTPGDDVTEQQKPQATGLIFLLVPKNVVAFAAAPTENMITI